VATADQQLVECAELDRDAHIVAPRNRTQREVLRRVLREEEVQRDDQLPLRTDRSAIGDQTRFLRCVHFVDTASTSRAVSDSTLVHIQRDARTPGLTDELALTLGVALHELVDDVHLITRDRLDGVRADLERHLLDHRVAKRLDPRRVVTRVGARGRRSRIQVHHQVDRAEEVR